ncbi:MAG: hypothetical protein ABIJ59_17275 [Pseudomonadota bacterium]
MITGVHISSSEMVINKDDSKKNSLPKLIKNQVVSAKVISLMPHGKAQLLVNGKIFVAKTAMLLTPGEEVVLKVVQEKDAIVLKLIGPGQKMTTSQITSLVSFFSKNESIPDITGTRLTQVKNLLMEMSLKSDKPDIDFLPRLIDKSGLIMEKKIAQVLLNEKSSIDIKTALNVLLDQDVKANIFKEWFNSGSGKSDALKTIAAFSESLENFQLLNHRSSETGRYLLPFPIFSESAFRFGQLLINTGDKTKSGGKDKDKLITISFLLEMTRLGPLRADFSILKQEITGRFLLCDQDTCDYVRSLIPDLKGQLADREYHVRQIECVLAKKEEVQPGSLIESLVKAGDGQVLNVVV